MVGDLGLVVLKGLLENGVGYLVSGWIDPQNPIDGAIGDVHRTLLPQLGISLRRAGKLTQIERVLDQPLSADLAGESGLIRRGAVIFDGTRGSRPALERFAGLPVAAPVVGICFDDEIARSETALVIDPVPTPDGVVRAIDEAFALSHVVRRPVLVLLRERARSMRGTLQCRDNVTPMDAPALVEHLEVGMPVSEAMERIDVVETADLDAGTAAGDTVGTTVRVCVITSRLTAQAVERSVARVQAALAELPTEPVALDVRVVALGAPTAMPVELLASSIVDRDGVLVVEPAGSGMGGRVRRAIATGLRARAGSLHRGVADPVVRGLDADAATEGAVLACVAGAIADVVASVRPSNGLGADPIVGQVAAAMAPLVSAASAASLQSAAAAAEARRLVGSSIVSRGARLHRPLSRPLAAALTIAQGSIGVPTRASEEFPTYVTEGGSRLTVATAHAVVERGRGVGSPDAQHGVFVVVGDGTAVAAIQAAMPGATFELVDELQPRLVAASIARACSGPLATAHVIVPTPVGVLRSPRGELAIERDLAGSERLAFTPLAEDVTYVAERHEGIDGGPVLDLADPRAASAVLPAVAQLTSSTYEVVRGSEVEGLERRGRTIRRSFLKGIFGVAS